MGTCSFKFASRFASRVELSTTEDPIDVQFSISVNLITTANPACSLRSYSKFYSVWHFVCAVHRARMLKRSEMEEISGNWFSIQFASSYGFDASYIHHVWLSTMQNISVHSGSDVSVKLIQLRSGLLRTYKRPGRRCGDANTHQKISKSSSSQSHSSSRVLIRERTYKQVVMTIKPPSQNQETIENVEFSSNYFLFINAIRLWWIKVEGDTFGFDWRFKYGTSSASLVLLLVSPLVGVLRRWVGLEVTRYPILSAYCTLVSCDLLSSADSFWLNKKKARF